MFQNVKIGASNEFIETYTLTIGVAKQTLEYNLEVFVYRQDIDPPAFMTRPGN